MGKDKNIKFLFTFCFLFLAFKIFAIYKTEFGLHGDEAQYWVWSRDLSWGYFSKPPLIAFLVRFFSTIFGNSIFAIKLFPVIFYIFTSFAVYFLAKIIFDKKIALVSGITFFLLPGVSLSSFLVSTDVALMLFWSLSLCFTYNQIKEPGIINAFFLGVSLGFGFLAKYAIIYYFICTIFYAFIDKNFFKHLLNNKRLYFLSFLFFLIIIFPNLYWNINNNWLTFGHTFDNASLGYAGFEIKEFLGFVLAQIFIVGPVFSIVFLRFYKDFFKLSGNVAFLISYSMPVLFIVSAESLLVRAHGNWAAVSFISLLILFVSIVLSKNNKIILINNLTNMVIGIIFFYLVMAGSNIKVFDQLRGYENFSKTIAQYSKKENIEDIVIQERMLYSLMVYHLRDFDYFFYTTKNPFSSVGHHFQIKKSLPEDNVRDFLYLGDTNSLGYLTEPYKISFLKRLNINQKMKDVKIYKYTFN